MVVFAKAEKPVVFPLKNPSFPADADRLIGGSVSYYQSHLQRNLGWSSRYWKSNQWKRPLHLGRDIFKGREGPCVHSNTLSKAFLLNNAFSAIGKMEDKKIKRFK